MRLFLTFIFSLVLIGSAHAAEKQLDWQVGVWTTERMDRYEDFQLVFFGRDFLLGDNVDQDRTKAKKLFEGAVSKNSKNYSLIGSIYLNETNNKTAAFKWFTRGIQSGDKNSKWYIGLLMNWTGMKLLKHKKSIDPPNIEGFALLFAAKQFGYEVGIEKIDSHYFQLDSQRLKKAKQESQKYFANPQLLIRQLVFLCENKNNRFGQTCTF